MILGLGNPGPPYEKTRHNVGFDLIELLAEQLNLFLKKPLFRNYRIASVTVNDRTIHLVQPLTFMNRSGDVLPHLMKKYGLELTDIVVAVDNMDLLPGRVRMKSRGSSAGHNGLKSFIARAGSPDFHRLYIGIGRPVKGETVVDHVLGLFEPEDRARIDEALERCSSCLRSCAGETLESFRNEINRKAD
jgi:PTH1 family peptidyl-tRNA hydrolase